MVTNIILTSSLHKDIVILYMVFDNWGVSFSTSAVYSIHSRSRPYIARLTSFLLTLSYYLIIVSNCRTFSDWLSLVPIGVYCATINLGNIIYHCANILLMFYALLFILYVMLKSLALLQPQIYLRFYYGRPWIYSIGLISKSIHSNYTCILSYGMTLFSLGNYLPSITY